MPRNFLANTVCSQRLVVVVTGVDSGETLERWTFNVAVDDVDFPGSGCDENEVGGGNGGKVGGKVGKSVKEINGEIAAIIRQVREGGRERVWHSDKNDRRLRASATFNAAFRARLLSSALSPRPSLSLSPRPCSHSACAPYSHPCVLVCLRSLHP